MIPSRAEWTTEPSIEMVETHCAFGWRVHRHQMKAGSRLLIVSSKPVPRDKSPNKALFTKGRATVTGEDGTQYIDREPGLWTPERLDMPAGTTTVNVVEDLEFWCFNYTANRNALPNVEPVRVKAGEAFEVPKKSLLFVASGECEGIKAPCSFDRGPAKTICRTNRL